MYIDSLLDLQSFVIGPDGLPESCGSYVQRESNQCVHVFDKYAWTGVICCCCFYRFTGLDLIGARVLIAYCHF